MKGLFWSLLATLAGTAMLVVGIAGVAGAFDGDDSSSSGSSSGSGSAADVADFTDCGASDPRFDEFNSIDLTGDAGSATLLVSCQGGNVELSMVATDFSTGEGRTVALWLYNKRDDAKLIAFSQLEARDTTVVTSGSLPEDSADYKKIVVTEEPPSGDFEEPERPTKIILQGRP
jgi:hypothetical protein